MLKYLKKFTLDIAPSVVATIVGAYIVHHYIIPAATPKDRSAAVSKPESAPVAAPDDAASAKPSFVKGVAEKASIERAVEKASEKSADSAPADSKKRHVPLRSAGKASEKTDAPRESSVAEERRDANDLARAAIERLRPANEPARVATAAPAHPPMPALPPPVTLASPSPEVFNAGTGAIMEAARPLPSALPTRSAEALRPLPPASIPPSPPIELHGDGSAADTATGRAAAVADDVVSAAKSVFHAVLPR